MSWFYNCLLDPYLSKNVFTNHLFCDWLCVDLTSESYTCSCQRVNCKPHFLKCESESFLSWVCSCLLDSYLVLDKADLAKVLEYMIEIKFRNIGWKRKTWIMKLNSSFQWLMWCPWQLHSFCSPSTSAARTAITCGWRRALCWRRLGTDNGSSAPVCIEITPIFN